MTVDLPEVSWLKDLRGRRDAATIVIGVLVAVCVAAASALFAQSDQTVRAIDSSYELQHTEEALSATTALRAALAVSLLIADARAEGRVSDEERDVALADLAAISAELTSRVDRIEPLGGGAPDLASHARNLDASVASFIGLIEETDLAGAQAEATRQSIPALERLESELELRRSDALERLGREQGQAGTMARAASIAVALLVPLVALAGFRIIQRRRQQERELKLALRHEEERSAVKDQMIANVSHQLRTPLTGIYGMAVAMLEQGFEDEEFSLDATEMIVAEADGLARMVDDLLIATKLDNSEIAMVPERLEPASVIAEVLEGTRFPQPIEAACEPGEVVADGIRLRQVIRNLIANAVAHGAGRRCIEGRVAGDSYIISVMDHGSGVDAATEPHLFKRFTRSESAEVATGSLGIGLAIASELTILMGGELTYRREQGMTAFDLSLPLARMTTAIVPAGT